MNRGAGSFYNIPERAEMSPVHIPGKDFAMTA
jgi:hypothetical protein